MTARLDHLVLTVAGIDVTVDWYARVLGFEPIRFGEGRRALAFDGGKLNLHPAGREFSPHAHAPTPGSADLCFTIDEPLDRFVRHLTALGVAVEAGPVPRTGTRADLISVYLRDPDGNLIEIANET